MRSDRPVRYAYRKKNYFVLISPDLEKHPNNCAGESKAIQVKFSSCRSQNYFLEKRMCIMKENSAHGKDQWQLLDRTDLLCSQIAWQNRDENVSSNLSSLCVSMLELVGFKLRNWRNNGHFSFQFRRFYFQVMGTNKLKFGLVTVIYWEQGNLWNTMLNNCYCISREVYNQMTKSWLSEFRSYWMKDWYLISQENIPEGCVPPAFPLYLPPDITSRGRSGIFKWISSNMSPILVTRYQ